MAAAKQSRISTSKNIKLLPWFLASLLVLIWGDIGYRLLFDKKVGSPVNQVSDEALPDIIPGQNKQFIFTDNVRDPFAYHDFKRVRALRKVVPTTVRPWIPPSLSLKGVILSEGRKTAVLKTSEGSTVFLSAGDTIEGVRILGIKDGVVEYSFERKDTTWTVVR
ncbi:MAG: hypothetical protein M1395_08095 [Bacteroidetes bacterium]|jgi:type II secretory pathway component PulC|nr:hypothetical protein [Bacteroidota bacterium]